jgi:hypothetical protein
VFAFAASISTYEPFPDGVGLGLALALAVWHYEV